jgi:hypothetical protein
LLLSFGIVPPRHPGIALQILVLSLQSPFLVEVLQNHKHVVEV